MYRSQIEVGAMAIDHVLYPTKKKEESIYLHTGDPGMLNIGTNLHLTLGCTKPLHPFYF